jgi:MFS transporter, DHA2 family, multidrug resistance protein
MSTKPLSKVSLLILNIGLSIATFLIVLDYSIANVSIPYISGSLGVSNDQGTYVITLFAVGNGIVIAITGWLTKRFGAVRLITVSVLLFTLLSWVCGIAWSFEMLIAARFLQGVASGPLIPLSQTLLVMHNAPEKKNIVLSYWSVVVLVGPVAGPVLGGWLTFDYSWPWIFFINLPIGLLSAAMIWYPLRHSETEKEKVPIDIFGLILLTIGVSSLQIFLDKGQQYDWFNSPFIRNLAIASFLSLSLLLIWQLTQARPILDIRLFKIKSFSVSVICIATAYAMYFGSVVLIPLWLQQNMGYTSLWAGIAVAPIGFAPILAWTAPGKILDKIGKIIPLCISFVLFSISCFYTIFFTTEVDIFVVSFSRFLLGLGLIFFVPGLIGMSIQDVPAHRLANAGSIFHFTRAIFGGIGTAAFTTLWIRRSAYHHSILGESLSPYLPNASELSSDLNILGIKGEPAIHLLNNAVDNQAAMLALNDCFYLMGFLFIALCFLLPLGRKRKQMLKDSAAL